MGWDILKETFGGQSARGMCNTGFPEVSGEEESKIGLDPDI